MVEAAAHRNNNGEGCEEPHRRLHLSQVGPWRNGSSSSSWSQGSRGGVSRGVSALFYLEEHRDNRRPELLLLFDAELQPVDGDLPLLVNCIAKATQEGLRQGSRKGAF